MIVAMIAARLLDPGSKLPLARGLGEATAAGGVARETGAVARCLPSSAERANFSIAIAMPYNLCRSPFFTERDSGDDLSRGTRQEGLRERKRP